MKKVNPVLPPVRPLLLLLFLIGLVTACKEDNEIKPQTIADIVQDTDSFSILQAAIRHAGMEDALKTGPLTVFAPNNAAFQASGYADAAAITSLPAASVRILLQNHILGKAVKATDLGTTDSQKLLTIQNSSLTLVRNSSGTFINGIKLVATDIEADNGYLHVVDRLLNP